MHLQTDSSPERGGDVGVEATGGWSGAEWSWGWVGWGWVIAHLCVLVRCRTCVVGQDGKYAFQRVAAVVEGRAVSTSDFTTLLRGQIERREEGRERDRARGGSGYDLG